MPGFNDVLVPYPYISNYGITANYTINSTTFFEATYGSIKNELAGGGSGGILTNDSSNRLNGDAGLPADLSECRDRALGTTTRGMRSNG